MKLPAFLSKPRWLSKDAATRCMAVMHDADSELVASLGRLAREDPDATVRLAAMKRLADPGITQGLAHDDADPNVRAQARTLWIDLLTGTHASAPSLVERLRLLKAQDNNELITHIARSAREAPMRQAALDRISRPALLFERALDDADSAIRLGLVERFDDETLLARLAERARKSDKQVSRNARERIDVLRIARGDDTTVEQRARRLCEQLEQLVRAPLHADAEATIATRWIAIEAAVPAPLRARYRAAQDLLVVSRTVPPLKSAQLEQAASSDSAMKAEATLALSIEVPESAMSSTKTDAEAVAATLIAQARFAASLDEAKAAQRQKQEQQHTLLGEFADTLRAFDAAIDSGASTHAHAAKARVDDLRRRIEVPLPRALAQRLAETEKRHADLSEWQHWADSQRRRVLCEAIDTIATTGIHPDAVASRVREAQAEWSRLDMTEGRTAAKPNGLTRRFHAACRAAMAPTQDYFRKRQALRQSHAQQVNVLLERGEALTVDSSDWPGIGALRRDMIGALRSLDSVEPRERKPLAERLKASLDALDARVARRDEEIECAKSALIKEAEALGTGVAQRGAIAAARELQQSWQLAGNGRRARDQAQWKAFRAAIDAVFERLDAERAERSMRDANARAQAETLCAELEAFAVAATPAERGALARMQSAWEALQVRDDGLTRRFVTAQSQVREAALRAERSRRQVRFEAWLTRYRLCRAAESDVESRQSLREKWNAAPVTDIASTQLAARFESSLAGNHVRVDDDDAKALLGLLLEIEFLAGIEAGTADREKRRMLQVGRLVSRLRGGAAMAPSDELADLMTRWSALDPPADAQLDARFERGVVAVLETLS
jgi:exonuclease SbcC